VSRFYTTIESDGVFYTDSNGREMLKRKRNQRDTWHVVIAEKESGNYYPVTSKIAIEDEHTRLAVLNDRAQGGSSLYDGVVELMVHRRLLHDDGFGVSEALNETVTARGHHYVFFGPKSDEHPTQEAKERLLQSDKITPIWPLFADISELIAAKGATAVRELFEDTPRFNMSLPENIKLLTFEPWNSPGTSEGKYLVRFEHIFESKEDPIYSKPVSLNLADFFGNDALIRETTLDGNQWLDETVKFKFLPNSVGNLDEQVRYQKIEHRDSVEIVLSPMEIRTFIVSNIS